jgi:hypothetical protein
MRSLRRPFSLVSLFSSTSATALACSVCIGGGPQTPDAGFRHSHGERFGVGIRQDYFAGDTLYHRYDRVENTGGEYLRQNNTSLNLSYDLDENWSAFVGLRYSAKTYRREEDGGMANRTESGITDPVIGLSYSGKIISTESRRIGFNLFAGASLPFGNTDRTGEEVAEHLAGEEHESAVHDHDLAMGTGQFGAVLAATLDYTEDRFVSRATVSYTYRPEGDHTYDFGDPVVWDVATGAQILTGGHDAFGVALLVGVTGEHVDHDRIDGVVEEKTGMHTLYAGPRLLVDFDSSIRANFQIDMPFAVYASSPSLISSWRARAGVTWRF